MISRAMFQSFLVEVEKTASMTAGSKALLASGLAGGAAAGAVGKDIYQDAMEGRTQRRAREFQQKQQLRAFSRGVGDE